MSVDGIFQRIIALHLTEAEGAMRALAEEERPDIALVLAVLALGSEVEHLREQLAVVLGESHRA